MKIIKFLDWNYKESASNFANSTRIELIDEDQYYQTYEDVWPDVAAGNKNLFNDYGQKWDRQSLRKDFDLKKTKKQVPVYNERGLQ
jgi:uridine kinase